MIQPSKLLVIASSARMLAQLACDAGFQPFAIDCFGDEDTRKLAAQVVKVASLALADVKQVVDSMRQRHDLTHVVYGSGFEKHTETLDYLEKHWVVWGNAAAVFRGFQDKPAFFAQLSVLSIPFPETVFVPPEDRGDWLLKPMHGEGGMGISRYQPDSTIERGDYCYWQRRLQGQAMSVLFLAGRGKVKALGFNRQRTTALDDDHAFVFAGVTNCADLSAANQYLVSDWLSRLVGVYPLQGLGSLDFMLVDGRCYLLEINSRIPASAQLYGRSIVSLHIGACQGVLGDVGLPQPKGYQIIYAQKPMQVPHNVNWPEWTVDRPFSGALIGKGEPICSIISAGKTVGQVEERLRQQQNFIEKLFKTGL